MPNIHFSNGTTIFYQPAQLAKELEQKTIICKAVKKAVEILKELELNYEFPTQSTFEKINDNIKN